MLALYRAGRQVTALRVFHRHRRLLAEEVGVEPAAELRELEAAILRHDPSLDPVSPVPRIEATERGTIPIALTSFIGRGGELGSAVRAIDENRLVTLTGPGGVGKTRLAVEVARRIRDRFPGGVRIIDLAGVQRHDLVADAVATAFDIDTRDASDEVAAVAAALAHRSPCLLVLDNSEHLVEAVAAVAVAILGAAATVRMLATSRRPLGVDGEFVHPVRPLPDGDAVRLFTERARMSTTEAEVPTSEASEICRQLDGLPLAIELAASQLRVISAAEIAARIGDQLRFRGAASGASPRQGSLGEMVQWSYDLLAPAVRSTFARLGVFASSMTLEAAEAVCASRGTVRRDVLGHITTLVDHSLLIREHVAVPPSRYRLLETLRLFALERLVEGGGGRRARRAHAEYFVELVERGGPQLWGPDERVWRLRLEADEPNVRAAMVWAGEHDPVLLMRLAVALWPYFEARWHERHDHGVAVLDSLIEQDVDAPEELRARALTAVAAMGGNRGDARHAIPRGFEAVDAFRRLRDERGLTEALAALGAALCNQGCLDEAEVAVAEGLALASRRDDTRLVAPMLAVAGAVARRRGDHVRAAELNRGELAAWREVGSRRGEAFALRRLAVSRLQLGATDEAARLCDRALDIWKDLDDPAGVAHVQTTLADIARFRGDLVDAVGRYDTALVDLQAIGDRRCTASTYKNLATIAAQRGENRQAAALYRQGLTLRHELHDQAGLAEVLEGLAGVGSAEGRDADVASCSAPPPRSANTADRRRRSRRRTSPRRSSTSGGRGSIPTDSTTASVAVT